MFYYINLLRHRDYYLSRSDLIPTFMCCSENIWCTANKVCVRVCAWSGVCHSVSVSEIISVREEEEENSSRRRDDGNWKKIKEREGKDCRQAFTGKHTWKQWNTHLASHLYTHLKIDMKHLGKYQKRYLRSYLQTQLIHLKKCTINKPWNLLHILHGPCLHDVFFIVRNEEKSKCGSGQLLRQNVLHPASFFRLSVLYSWKGNYVDIGPKTVNTSGNALRKSVNILLTSYISECEVNTTGNTCVCTPVHWAVDTAACSLFGLTQQVTE